MVQFAIVILNIKLFNAKHCILQTSIDKENKNFDLILKKF